MSYPPQPPPYGYPAYRPPDHQQAVTIMILGILSLVVCQIIGPFAWVMGRRALNEIDASGGAIGGRSSVQAGYICGIISSALLIIGLVFVVVGVVVAIVGAMGSTSNGY